jgi:hypothetical protein
MKITKRIIIKARNKQNAFEKALKHRDLVKESGESEILIDELNPLHDVSNVAEAEKLFLIREVGE